MPLHVERHERVVRPHARRPRAPQRAHRWRSSDDIVDAIDDDRGRRGRRRGRRHRCAARVLLGCRRVEPRRDERQLRPARRGSEQTCATIYDGFLARPRLHAPDGRGRERPRGRRRLQPRAGVRRASRAAPAARFDARFAQHRAPSRRRPHVAARTRRRPAGGGRDRPVRRAHRRRARPPGSGSRGGASPTTSCSTRRSRSRAARPRCHGSSRATIKATLRETPWFPGFREAIDIELERQRWSFEQGFFGARSKK